MTKPMKCREQIEMAFNKKTQCKFGHLHKGNNRKRLNTSPKPNYRKTRASLPTNLHILYYDFSDLFEHDDCFSKCPWLFAAFWAFLPLLPLQLPRVALSNSMHGREDPSHPSSNLKQARSMAGIGRSGSLLVGWIAKKNKIQKHRLYTNHIKSRQHVSKRSDNHIGCRSENPSHRTFHISYHNFQVGQPSCKGDFQRPKQLIREGELNSSTSTDSASGFSSLRSYFL